MKQLISVQVCMPGKPGISGNRRIMYDESCDFCTFIKDIAERYSTTGRLVFIPFGTIAPRVNGLFLEVPERVTTVDESGNISSDGIDTVIQICRSVGVVLPFYPLMLFLKMIGAGDVLYDLIAKRRQFISVALKRICR